MREGFLNLGMNDRQAGINLQPETGVSVYQFNSLDKDEIQTRQIVGLGIGV